MVIRIPKWCLLVEVEGGVACTGGAEMRRGEGHLLDGMVQEGEGGGEVSQCGSVASKEKRVP